MRLSQWVSEAIDHARARGEKSAAGREFGQSELARRLTARLERSIDRAAVNKMTTGERDVSGDEMVAISEITGYLPPISVLGEPQMQEALASLAEVSDPDRELLVRILRMWPRLSDDVREILAMIVEGRSPGRTADNDRNPNNEPQQVG